MEANRKLTNTFASQSHSWSVIHVVGCYYYKHNEVHISQLYFPFTSAHDHINTVSFVLVLEPPISWAFFFMVFSKDFSRFCVALEMQSSFSGIEADLLVLLSTCFFIFDK